MVRIHPRLDAAREETAPSSRVHPLSNHSRQPHGLKCGQIGAYSVGALAVAAILDIATAEALSMTTHAPLALVKVLQIADLIASPCAFGLCALAVLVWALNARGFFVLFDLALAISVAVLLSNVAGLIVSIFEPKVSAGYLLLSASLVYIENIVVFVAYYWRFDHRYQDQIAAGEKVHPGVMFPQNALGMESMRGWRPEFMDYLFLSFNTASTFGPTLPVPLRASMQIGMMAQVGIAMAVLIMIAARAIGLIA